MRGCSSDNRFAQSISVTLRYVVLSVPVFMVTGLALAILLNPRCRACTSSARSCSCRSVLSGVAVAVLWVRMLQHGDRASSTRSCGGLGIEDPPRWLGVRTGRCRPSSDRACGVSAAARSSTWPASRTSRPHLYEAAEIDGASAAVKFRQHHAADALADALLRASSRRSSGPSRCSTSPSCWAASRGGRTTLCCSTC